MRLLKVLGLKRLKFPSKREILPDLPWLIPLGAFVLPFIGFMLDYITTGRIPSIGRIDMAERSIRLPFQISSAFNLILAPLVAYAFMRVLNSKWLERMDFRNILLLGTCFGICLALTVEPGFVFTIGAAVGLGLLLYGGYDAGFMASVIISFKLGLISGIGMMFGSCFAFSLNFGMTVGAVIGIGMGFLFGLSVLFGSLLGALCSSLSATLSTDTNLT